ncbi:hypothetical protein AYI68_g5423 [Smittium mucronatum]|uniref:Uncharacterized protein n=1 Tax=Smittium mucronatum TaxID=133383 RepID=A0A1R0GUB7_9FUNG|nr:hypothetical protein AYI68_g5423 [Smittium mucronatum]
MELYFLLDSLFLNFLNGFRDSSYKLLYFLKRDFMPILDSLRIFEALIPPNLNGLLESSFSLPRCGSSSNVIIDDSPSSEALFCDEDGKSELGIPAATSELFE